MGRTQRLIELDVSLLCLEINVDSSKAAFSQDDGHFKDDLGSLHKQEVTQFLQTSAPTLKKKRIIVPMTLQDIWVELLIGTIAHVTVG